METNQVWDSLPLLIKIRWYGDAVGYIFGAICMFVLIALLLYGFYLECKKTNQKEIKNK